MPRAFIVTPCYDKCNLFIASKYPLLLFKNGLFFRKNSGVFDESINRKSSQKMA